MTTSSVDRWRAAGELLHTLGALEASMTRVRQELADLVGPIAALSDVPDGVGVATDHGVVTLHEGRVKRRRAVDTNRLNDMYEDLPPSVQAMCTVEDTATIDMSQVDFDDVEALEGIMERAGAARVVRRVWPTVADLDRHLPAHVREVVVIGQERGPAYLVLDSDGMKVTSL